MNGITEIWEAVSRKAGELFEWAQAHPKFAYLFVAILLAFWLTGCCAGGNGRASGCTTANCGFSMTASPKRNAAYISLYSA